MRLAVYASLSGLVTAFTLLHTLMSRPQFYSACVQLTESGASMLVLLNGAVVLAWLVGKVLQRVFFGPLRALEVEHLYERAWFAVTETFIAMTIFRDEFDMRFISLFIMLLGVKMFHWLTQDRVDYMEQTEQLEPSFHVRMMSIMALLFAVNGGMIYAAVVHIQRSGPSMMLMFGFEYTILASMLVGVFIKYVLFTLDHARGRRGDAGAADDGWERRSTLLLYTELATDLFRLWAYTVFFIIVVHYYGPPLHLIRDLYITLHSFIQRCRTFLRYRRATANMEGRYRDATAADLASSHGICIICREEMVLVADLAPDTTPVQRERLRPKRLPCGHVFHGQCLRSWLQRQQSCPTCRRSVFADYGPPQPGPAAPAAPPPADNPAAGPAAPPGPIWGGAVAGGPAPAPPPLSVGQAAPAAQEPITPQGHTRVVQGPDGIPMLAVPLSGLLNSAGLTGGSTRLPSPRLATARSATVDSLEELTTEQLSNMEGRTREALLARLGHLQRLQDQLALVALQLSQISSLVDLEVDSVASRRGVGGDGDSAGASSGN